MRFATHCAIVVGAICLFAPTRSLAQWSIGSVNYDGYDHIYSQNTPGAGWTASGGAKGKTTAMTTGAHASERAQVEAFFHSVLTWTGTGTPGTDSCYFKGDFTLSSSATGNGGSDATGTMDSDDFSCHISRTVSGPNGSYSPNVSDVSLVAHFGNGDSMHFTLYSIADCTPGSGTASSSGQSEGYIFH